MIKFFRHIRQDMIKDLPASQPDRLAGKAGNKVTKYILYAIGEILLVVIGILIALQINNNNEVKKSREFEVKMLKEVRRELIQDTIYFRLIKERAETAIKGAEGMLQLYPEAQPIADSVSKYAKLMTISFQYIYHKGAYEAIKSTGIDKISNDSVRSLLTDMYDFRLPRAQNFIENDNADKMSPSDQLSLLADIEILKMPDGKSIPNLKTHKSFVDNKQVAKLIFNTFNTNRHAVQRLESLLRASELLLQLLDRELEIENPLENIPQNNWQTQ